MINSIVNTPARARVVTYLFVRARARAPAELSLPLLSRRSSSRPRTPWRTLNSRNRPSLSSKCELSSVPRKRVRVQRIPSVAVAWVENPSLPPLLFLLRNRQSSISRKKMRTEEREQGGYNFYNTRRETLRKKICKYRWESERKKHHFVNKNISDTI